MIEALKSFSPTKYSLEDLVFLSMSARSLTAEFINVGIDVPSWLLEVSKRIATAIKGRVRDELEMKLAQAKQRRSTLKTPDERRKETDAEIERLEAKLA